MHAEQSNYFCTFKTSAIKYPPFIFLLKNERTGKVVLDLESFEKQDIKDMIASLSRTMVNQTIESFGAETLLSSHMKGKSLRCRRMGKLHQIQNRNVEETEKKIKIFFQASKRASSAKPKLKETEKRKAKKQDDTSCAAKNIGNVRKPLRPIIQKSKNLSQLQSPKSLSHWLAIQNTVLESPLASPVTFGKNKENVCAALSDIQQVNIVRIDGDGTTKSSLHDKISNAKKALNQ